MKLLIYLLALLFVNLVYINTFAQNKFNDTGKLASLCKVWGMLKYFHPEVGNGKRDWDKDLMEKIPVVLKAENRAALDKIYTSWIACLGPIDELKISPELETVTESNKFLEWRKDSVYFSNEMDSLMNFIFTHRFNGENYYASAHQYTHQAQFVNENDFKGQLNPSKEMRLLALFRYWNMIEYYFPSKYLIGEDWQNVLNEMIPDFYFNNQLHYVTALHELVASIHDSHGMLMPPDSNKTGYYCADFTMKVIGDKAVVTGVIKDSIPNSSGMNYGDVITAVNDTLLADYIAAKKKYISASNDAVVLRNIPVSDIVCGSSETISLTIDRGGSVMKKTIYRDTCITAKGMKLRDTSKPVFRILDDGTGYINMGRLTGDMVKEAYSFVAGKSAVIFDVRNYPKGTMYEICRLFGKAFIPFVKFTEPDFSCPGTFKWANVYKCGPLLHKKTKNRKIIVLINEQTQSHAEFTCMAFKTLPNVTFIGSQTAGADGNVSLITLPGGYKTYMSGLGVYYPDCTVTQRIGIVPDIEIHPTIKGIQYHRDEVLERAINYIKSGK